MVIDFHTHIWPDKIAGRTREKLLQEHPGCDWYADGTAAGLLSSMKEAGVDLSVVLPVVTRVEQFDSVNAFAAEVCKQEGLISFGGIHPADENYREHLRTIRDLGLQGIKLHPDYQDAYPDETETVRLVDYALELGLTVLFHTGYDHAFPDLIHGTAARFRNLLRQVDAAAGTIVLAHMGCDMDPDGVEEYLVGQPVYLDLAYCMPLVEEEQKLRIIREHGVDRVLFATDCPWRGQKDYLEQFRALPLTEEEKERILYQNGAKILHLEG